GHVRKQRTIDLASEITKFVNALERFRKNRVGACSNILTGAINGLAEIFDRARVSPGDDHEVRVTSRRDSGFDFSDHFFCWNERFAGEMTATFRELLIFDMTASEPGLFQFLDRPGYIWHSAKPGIRIDNGRNLNGRGDIAGELGDLRQG